MHIISNDPIVRQCLETIAQIVLENGGEIHPQLTINHQAERLWIGCNSHADGSTLLKIPHELFIPITGLEWSSENALLCFANQTGSLSAVQQTLLDAMVRIYNATDKINMAASFLPTQLLPADPVLLEWLNDAILSFSIPERNTAELFISTRILNSNEKWDDSGKPCNHLMPLIDLLNNHPFGAKFERPEQDFWTIALARPITDSDECFVRYNKNDSLHNAISYGYFESNIRHMSSLQCEIQNATVGLVRIIGNCAKLTKTNAPQILPHEPVLSLRDIVLQCEKLPTLRTFLGLAVRSKYRDLSQKQAVPIADELIASLIEANRSKYHALSELCQKDTEKYPLRALFGQVAEHQLGLLEDLKHV